MLTLIEQRNQHNKHRQQAELQELQRLISTVAASADSILAETVSVDYLKGLPASVRSGRFFNGGMGQMVADSTKYRLRDLLAQCAAAKHAGNEVNTHDYAAVSTRLDV
jgi:hypothetical protein